MGIFILQKKKRSTSLIIPQPPTHRPIGYGLGIDTYFNKMTQNEIKI